jgi:hypothetical protein
MCWKIEQSTLPHKEGKTIPRWIDECVKRYLKKGFTEDEAWKRCRGAYEKRKKKKKKGKS